MMSVLRWCVVPLLAGTLVGQTAAKPRAKKAAKPAQPAVTLQDIQSLRDALTAQQQQIEQLKQEVQQKDQAWQQAQQQLQQAQATASDAQSKAAAAESAASSQKDTVVKLDNDMADVKTTLTNTAVNTQEQQKSFAALEGAVGHIKMSGDLRLRFEPFFGGGPANAAAPDPRMRERFRLRFNITSKINSDFAVGFSVASGDLGDPVSTNSTETGFFTRKPLAIDKAYGIYNPHYLKPFTLTVGKFGYTWQRTELTWDNDLNPEGASAAVAWDWKHGMVNHFAVVAYGTPIFEVGGGPDTFMEGGQVQAGFTLLPRLKFSADAAYYDFHNADTIAQNQAQSPSNGFATQGITNAGGGNFGFSASGLSNNFGVINGKRTFASQYGIVDAIARLDFDSGRKRWPVYALFDFAQNTKACDNLAAFAAAGVAAPACNSHERHGYWGEFKVGQTKNKGDLLLGYTFARIERDAVLSAFDFSDLRAPTNVVEHRVEAYYQAYQHVQIGVTGLVGRQLVTAQSPIEERWLKRWQFDTIFSF
ncbi:MAG: putative porin [Terriglobales bacterium]